MDNSTTSKGLPLPVFTGEREKFQMFWTRFMAYAHVMRFAEGLMDTLNPNLPADDTTASALNPATAANAAAIKAWKANDLAMANFTMAFQTEQLLQLVYAASSTEWPQGRADLVVAALKRKYQPTDVMAMAEMKVALGKIKMKKDEAPSTLFEQMSGLENRYQTLLDNNEKVATVLSVAPKEYMSVITSERRHQGTALTADHIQEAMMELYRATHEAKGQESGDKEEMALIAFKGKCNKCGKVGHKAADCKSKGGTQPGKQRFKGKCNNCGKQGHKATDCWLLEENKAKRPAGYKVAGSELGNTAVDKTEMLLTHVDLDDEGWTVVMKKKRTPGKCKTCTHEDEMPNLEVAMTHVDNDEMPNLVLGEVDLGLAGMKTFPDSQKLLKHPNFWIADTGASVHISPHKIGMHNTKKLDQRITMGNENVEKSSIVGDIKGIICDRAGNELDDARLTDVAYIPGAGFNLFSCTKLMTNGWKLGGDDTMICLTKGDKVLKFDIPISTKEGVVFAMCMRRELAATAADDMDAKKAISKTYAQAHATLGHLGVQATKKSAEYLGWKVSGPEPVCVECTEAKAKQKSVPQEAESQPLEKGEMRVYLDICPMKAKKGEYVIPKPNWCMVVEEKTQYKTSGFYATKDGMVEPVCTKFKQWETAGKPVTHLRMDNAGENKKLQARAESADWKLGLKYEYTARDTPQQNSLVEVAFGTVGNRGRAMMIAANLPEKERPVLFREAFKCATQMDNLMVIKVDGKEATRYEHFGEPLPKFANFLRTWGEAGTVKTKTKTTPKLANKGAQCMFVGYADDHAGDCYRMYNPKTRKIMETRDITWLNRMYYEKRDSGGEIAVDQSDLLIPTIEAGENINPTGNTPMAAATVNVVETVSLDDDDDEPEPEVAKPAEGVRTTRSGRTVHAAPRLIEECGQVANDMWAGELNFSRAELGFYSRINQDEFGLVGAALGGGFMSTTELHPMKYKEAMAGPDKAMWEKAVEEEYERMVKLNVFEAIPESEVPEGTKILTSTWAMKKKSNGTFRARINARGYEQVDGEHYDEDSKAAPVASLISIRIVLVLAIMAGWYAHLMDVKGAFLHGKFEKGRRVFMKIPEGFEKWFPVGWVLELLATLYGTKQAAKQFWLELIKALKKMNFKLNRADPCVYHQWTEDGLTIWVSWVDDILSVGPKGVVLRKKSEFQKDHFECDDVGPLKEYVGCKIDRNWVERWMRITQPVQIQSFRDEFNLPEGGHQPMTPAEAGTVLTACDKEALVPEDMHSEYRSGVGKMMHVMRWSRPEILNPVRELTRFLKETGRAHYKAMQRGMLYCLNTPNRGLLLKPDCEWDGSPEHEFVIEGRCDSEFAKDTITRRSVGGHAVFLHGAPILERSRMQPIVATSVTEAEFIELAETVQDMLHAMHILEQLGLKVQKPMKVWCDNQGAVDLANNWSATGRTRHMDVRYKFILELKEDGVVHVGWFSGDENDVDFYTKNVGRTDFERQAATFVGRDVYMAVD